MKSEQLITNYKIFDNQLNYIATGAVISNTQYSSFIRSSNQITDDNHKTYPIGHLQDFDLEWFTKYLDQTTIKKIKSLADCYHGIILYCFFHHYKNQKIIHGYLVTTTKHEYITFDVTNNKNYNRSLQLLHKIMNFLLN